MYMSICVCVSLYTIVFLCVEDRAYVEGSIEEGGQGQPKVNT